MKEISRSGGDGVETEACSLIGNSGSDRQPEKMSKYWSNVNMWRSTGYKTLSRKTRAMLISPTDIELIIFHM